MQVTSTKVITRKNYKRSNGARSVYLQFLQNRKTHLISLNIPVPESKWDPVKFRVRGSSDEIRRLNNRIFQLQNKANNIILDMQLANQPITFTRFKQAFLDEEGVNESFFSFIERQIELHEGKFSPGTIKGYWSQLSKLKQFKPQISFAEVDALFMKQYTNWMINEQGNNKNTVKRCLKFIKHIMNKALLERIIQENPVKNFPIGEIKGDREFLTLDELNKLEELSHSGKLSRSQVKVLEYFLFDCYTGLRYGDLQRLQYKNLFLDEKEPFLRIKTQKTGETIIVPLIARALALVPEQEFENETVFNMLTSQATNRNLIKIMDKAGIRKHITNHCARHTFGACGIQQGIPIEVLKKLMGHSHIETTEIYTQIQDEVKFREMRKWEE